MPNNPENERAEVDQLERQIEELSKLVPSDNTSNELDRMRRRLDKLRKEIYSKLTPWQRVQLARHSQRPVVPEFIDFIFEDFVELHGDRRFEDDPAMIGGMARFHGEPCMVIGTHKGKDTKQKLQRNFGQFSPSSTPPVLIRESALKSVAKQRPSPATCVRWRGCRCPSL